MDSRTQHPDTPDYLSLKFMKVKYSTKQTLKKLIIIIMIAFWGN